MTDHAILDLLDRWASAERYNDAGALAPLLAEDFVGVGPAGFVLSRDEWLIRFQNGLVNRAFALEEPQVHDHGGTAVVVGIQAQETSFAGGDNSGQFRVTIVAVRPADRWQLASIHIGPLQRPPAISPTDPG